MGREGRQKSGHMDFGEWSGKISTTRATAQLGGHPVSDFKWLQLQNGSTATPLVFEVEKKEYETKLPGPPTLHLN